MSPIENIWAIIVYYWKPERERTPDELLANISNQWELFRNQPHLVRNHVSSVPHSKVLCLTRRFHQVWSWSVGDVCIKTHQVKGKLVPDPHQLYSDFNGRHLVVTTVNFWPYLKTITLQNGTISPISGIDFSVINSLSEILNFTYHIVLSPDGNWGGPQPDETITGLVGQVARYEAHAAICGVTITESRETVVDFTAPYYFEAATLVSPAPKEKNRSFAILSPFTVEVWLCIIIVTVLVGPLLYLVSRLLVVCTGEEEGAQYSLQSLSFNMYRSLMLQTNLMNSSRWSLRIISFSWYLFCLYIYAMYSGTLTAALAIRDYEKPIDSLYDLAQAHRDGYTIATTRDSSYDAAFKSAKGGIYQDVWKLFNHEEPSKSFLPNPDTGIEMVLRQKYVFINSLLSTKLKAAQRGREKFYLARQTFLPQGYGIVCSIGSPFKDVFSKVLLEIKDIHRLTIARALTLDSVTSTSNSPSKQFGVSDRF
ncbi:glutamate receptor ionotropic, delta-1-like [Panulirus ornatus]|uniref:glutamate receptor ionotropic, delta-1-like n=1 Tax=Panulirus ornatus TaxID=150431 RepID=UPI003A8C0D79